MEVCNHQPLAEGRCPSAGGIWRSCKSRLFRQ